MRGRPAEGRRAARAGGARARRPGVHEQALELSRRYPAARGPAGGRRRGDPQRASSSFFAEVADELLQRRHPRDERHSAARGARACARLSPYRWSTRNRTLGALTFVTGPSGRRFDERDLELAEELARRCATALDNARLYGERAYIARTLQESLLPAELPEIPGIEAAARFRPTGEGSEMGGDFYDLFETGSRGWTVVMGDVCGKGPDAAAVTALARYTLRAAAMRDRLPSRGLHDPERGAAAPAQRPPLLHGRVRLPRDGRRRRARRVRQRRAPASAPAARPTARWSRSGRPARCSALCPIRPSRTARWSLSPGDALVFYTDGVIEAARRAAGPRRGAARGAARARAPAARPMRSQRRVEEAAVRSQEGRPRDDIAVLVLRVAP